MAEWSAMGPDESRMDTKTQIEIVQSEDTALITMAQELDMHTGALRKSVLDAVRSMRNKITAQATEMIDNERGRSREYERRLLSQVESLQRLLDQRTHDLEAERALSERMVVLHQQRIRRRHTHNLAAEGLRRWHHYVVEQKRRMRLLAFLSQVRRERVVRQQFVSWRFEVLKRKHQADIDRVTGEYRRAAARMQAEHQTVENTSKLEMLAMRENLAKEEERRALLEERLKAAFMRGVCALNMEAMQVLRHAPQDGDVSVASLLQALNLTSSSFDTAGAEPASTDRLLKQQEALQAQLVDMQQQLHNTQGGPEAMIQGTVARAAAAAPPLVVRAPRQAASGIPQPEHRVTLHPRPASANVPPSAAKKAPMIPHSALLKTEWRK